MIVHWNDQQVTILCIYQQFEADMNEQECLEDDPDWKYFNVSTVQSEYYGTI